MAGKPQKRPMATNADSATPLLGNPKFIEEMTLIQTGGSVQIGIPYAARQFLGYQPGEIRAVEVYEDGVFIPMEAPDE